MSKYSKALAKLLFNNKKVVSILGFTLTIVDICYVNNKMALCISTSKEPPYEGRLDYTLYDLQSNQVINTLFADKNTFKEVLQECQRYNVLFTDKDKVI